MQDSRRARAAEGAVSTVVEGARIELLRVLAYAEDTYQRYEVEAAAGVVDLMSGTVPTSGYYPRWVPIWVPEWRSDPDDIRMAAREATRLGDIESQRPEGWAETPFEVTMRITEQGYRWIRERHPEDAPTEPAP